MTKPGILFGNAVNALAGFGLASKAGFSPWLFLSMLVGLLSVIGSGCIFNNYIDREIDAKMARTKSRPFVKGTVSVPHALLFAATLGLFGIALLAVLVNPLSASIAAVGFGIYVAVYSFSKHYSVNATLIGSLAGSVPPVVGYCAVTNQFDRGAWLLFLLITCWQMPHFYAIAIYRMKEYAQASIPVHPIVRGVFATKVEMLLYIVLYTITASFFTFTALTGPFFLLLSVTLGAVWFFLGMTGFTAKNDAKWGRSMFLFSLVVVMLSCVVLTFQ